MQAAKPAAPPMSILLGRNHIVSVSSYGPAADTGGYAGGSNIDAYFTAFLTLMCSGTYGTTICTP